MLDPNDKRHLLAGALVDTIQRFTTIKPMTAEEVIEALCFTAGHAAVQVAAHSRHSTNELRDLAVVSVDKGITEARQSMRGGGGLILPATVN